MASHYSQRYLILVKDKETVTQVKTSGAKSISNSGILLPDDCMSSTIAESLVFVEGQLQARNQTMIIMYQDLTDQLVLWYQKLGFAIIAIEGESTDGQIRVSNATIKFEELKELIPLSAGLCYAKGFDMKKALIYKYSHGEAQQYAGFMRDLIYHRVSNSFSKTDYVYGCGDRPHNILSSARKSLWLNGVNVEVGTPDLSYEGIARIGFMKANPNAVLRSNERLCLAAGLLNMLYKTKATGLIIIGEIIDCEDPIISGIFKMCKRVCLVNCSLKNIKLLEDFPIIIRHDGVGDVLDQFDSLRERISKALGVLVYDACVWFGKAATPLFAIKKKGNFKIIAAPSAAGKSTYVESTNKFPLRLDGDVLIEKYVGWPTQAYWWRDPILEEGQGKKIRAFFNTTTVIPDGATVYLNDPYIADALVVPDYRTHMGRMNAREGAGPDSRDLWNDRDRYISAHSVDFSVELEQAVQESNHLVNDQFLCRVFSRKLIESFSAKVFLVEDLIHTYELLPKDAVIMPLAYPPFANRVVITSTWNYELCEFDTQWYTDRLLNYRLVMGEKMVERYLLSVAITVADYTLYRPLNPDVCICLFSASNTFNSYLGGYAKLMNTYEHGIANFPMIKYIQRQFKTDGLKWSDGSHNDWAYNGNLLTILGRRIGARNVRFYTSKDFAVLCARLEDGSGQYSTKFPCNLSSEHAKRWGYLVWGFEKIGLKYKGIQTIVNSQTIYTKVQSTYIRDHFNITEKMLHKFRAAAFKFLYPSGTVIYDTRVSGMLDGKYISVAGHMVNIMLEQYVNGDIDIMRYMFTLSDNIRRSTQKNGFDEIQKLTELVLMAEDGSESHGHLWHNVTEYRTAILASIAIANKFNMKVDKLAVWLGVAFVNSFRQHLMRKDVEVTVSRKRAETHVLEPLIKHK